jgi:hypothetical protein
MVQRRPLRASIVARVREFKSQEAEEHRKKLETDPKYRAERAERKRSFSPAFPSAKKLPPWPLGPQRRVEKRFRETVLGSPLFRVLMRARPAAASEILVAAIIEDSPEEDHNSRMASNTNTRVTQRLTGRALSSRSYKFIQRPPWAGCISL